MRIKFHPMPWLTLITLICLGILISLGTWQYQRLQWKTNLLTEIDQAAQAAPLSSVSKLSDLFNSQQPLDFRRVGLDGQFIKTDTNNGDPFHLMMSDGKAMLWHLFQPFQTKDGIVYVTTATFPHVEKQTPPTPAIGQQSVSGYVRLVRPASAMQPVSSPDKNEWYVFNGEPETENWAEAVSGERIPVAYFIDRVSSVNTADQLPVLKPELPNNHLEYMLTWYSFALILTVIYFLLHKKQGRLQFGNKNA